MAYHISSDSLDAAIRHLCRYGDTDVFPHLPELAFLADEKDVIITELSSLDLDSYLPAGAIEALAPKARFSFRIAHQMPVLDTLLLLACVVEIGEKIETKRLANSRPFSYRFLVDKGSGQLFRPDRTYKDWLHKQQDILNKDKKIKTIISTDISDFYSRINFHRLENLLDEVATGHGAVRFVKRHIKIIRAKQSFGLPVGGSAARLLSELALSDTDQALQDKGLLVTRFVDDFRIFLRGQEDAYDALGYLAEQLGINEGLSLNAAKTSIGSRRDYVRQLERLTTDIEEEVEGVALDALTSNIYFDDNPDEHDIELLKGLNLVELLENEIKSENWDTGRIKVIFRALKIVKPIQAIEFITGNFSDLLVFAKETCLLMEELEKETPHCFDVLLEAVIDAILKPPAASVQVIRTWLLEIFVRGIIDISLPKLKGLEILPSVGDKRQLLLIRGRCQDKNYFRKQKTATDHFSDLELSCLVWGASCLPKDEYEKWIDYIKPSFKRPLGHLFLKWVVKNKTTLMAKLTTPVLDHPD